MPKELGEYINKHQLSIRCAKGVDSELVTVEESHLLQIVTELESSGYTILEISIGDTSSGNKFNFQITPSDDMSDNYTFRR